MKGYLVSIIWVSVIVGVAELISLHIAGVQKYIKMIGALCVLCVVVSPILNIGKFSENLTDELKKDILEDQNLESYEKYQEILNEYLNEYSADKLKEEIRILLKENFEIPEDESEVILLTEKQDQNITLKKVQILLSGKSIFNNPYNIENYIKELLNCSCEVLIN